MCCQNYDSYRLLIWDVGCTIGRQTNTKILADYTGDCENIDTLYYHHQQIESMIYYPLFMVRSWNNGMRCISLYILTHTSNQKNHISQIQKHKFLGWYNRTSKLKDAEDITNRQWDVDVILLKLCLKCTHLKSQQHLSVDNRSISSLRAATKRPLIRYGFPLEMGLYSAPGNHVINGSVSVLQQQRFGAPLNVID